MSNPLTFMSLKRQSFYSVNMHQSNSFKDTILLPTPELFKVELRVLYRVHLLLK